MKIAILTQYYPPEIGAPQARLSQLARRCVERGHQVFVLTAMPNYPQGRLHSGYGGLFRRERIDGVTVLRTFIYPSKSLRFIPRLANYFSFVFSSLIGGLFALPRVDYLLTESPPLFLGISGFLLSRVKGARWIFNVSDLWPQSVVSLGVLRDGLLLKISSALESWCYRHAAFVSGQSREILANIQERFPRVRTYLLSNGVDTELFSPEPREGAPSRKCVVLYAGLHGLAQGLDQLLHAAARLRDLDRIQIVLIGDGPEKESLRRLASHLALSNVIFLDSQPRAAMPRIVASADVAVVPLRGYIPGAVPSKLYEAMAAALPVVLVAEGEAAGIVRQYDAGVVVSPGNVAGLGDALQRLSQDPELRRRLGENGRRAVLARFDRRTIADSFITHLEQVA